MHPLTGLAPLLPVALLALRVDHLGVLLALTLVPLLLLASRSSGRQRLRPWAAVILPLALGLLLVHGHWLDSALGTTVVNRGAALLPAACLFLRVALMLAWALWWLSTTTPERLMRALWASRLPPGAAYLLASPLLLAEQLKARLATIAQAQAARGVDLQASWIKRWRSLLALALPLVVWTVADVGERAAALDARAFRRQARRTTLDAPRAAPWERCLIGLALAAAIVIAGSAVWP